MTSAREEEIRQALLEAKAGLQDALCRGRIPSENFSPGVMVVALQKVGASPAQPKTVIRSHCVSPGRGGSIAALRNPTNIRAW